MIRGLSLFQIVFFDLSCAYFGVSLLLLSLSPGAAIFFRLALRETHSRLFRDLSSSSGSACVPNPGQILIFSCLMNFVN